MAQHPAALEAALGVVNVNLIHYAQTTLARGAAGIFLSVPATSESLTLEQYERFMRPFDVQPLEAIRGKGEGHVLHAHGEHLSFDRLLDYPAHAQVKRALAEGGNTRFILAPGCSLPTYAYPSLIRAARAESGQVGSAAAGGGRNR